MLRGVEISHQGTSISVGSSRDLFRLPPRQRRRNEYVAARDGKRFLVIVPVPEAAEPAVAVLNWPLLLNK
jgi:hypothetical protein